MAPRETRDKDPGGFQRHPLPSGKSLPRSGVFDGTGACFIETGSGRAGYGAGDFHATPVGTRRGCAMTGRRLSIMGWIGRGRRGLSWRGGPEVGSGDFFKKVGLDDRPERTMANGP